MAIDGGFRLSWGYPQIIQVTKDNGNTILGLKPMFLGISLFRKHPYHHTYMFAAKLAIDLFHTCSEWAD